MAPISPAPGLVPRAWEAEEQKSFRFQRVKLKSSGFRVSKSEFRAWGSEIYISFTWGSLRNQRMFGMAQLRSYLEDQGTKKVRL